VTELACIPTASERPDEHHRRRRRPAVADRDQRRQDRPRPAALGQERRRGRPPPRRAHVPARRDRGIVAAVVAVTALAFLSGVTGDFVSWDDDTNFTNNPTFRASAGRRSGGRSPPFHFGVYQPLAWLALERSSSSGLSPAVYHLVSWLLHALNARSCTGCCASCSRGPAATRSAHAGRPGSPRRGAALGACTPCARRRSPGRPASRTCWRRVRAARDARLSARRRRRRLTP
jgi:hypothetical protein